MSLQTRSNAFGFATTTMALPAYPDLHGAEFFLQGFVLDLAGAGGGFATTPGLAAILGH